MTTQPALRTVRINSPRPVLKRTNSTSSPKSILKRPSPLPISPTSDPFPFAMCLSVHLSPDTGSPHVHFPPTPSLASTFAAYSPNTYERAFADCKSPAPFDHSIRFRTLTPHVPLHLHSQQTLHRSLAFLSPESPYPRSPYPFVPSSPLSPADDKENVIEARTSKSNLSREARVRVNARPHKRDNANAPSSPAARGSRTRSLDGVLKSKTPKRPNELQVPSPSQIAIPRVCSPLIPEAMLSPVEESPPVATLSLELRSDSEGEGGPSSRLSRAFWQSVSLIDLHEQEDAVMSCAYPLSAVALQESLGESTPVSAVPPFLFGRSDGTLWSPGLPRKKPVWVDSDGPVENPTSVLSPSARKSSFGTPEKSMVASPSPNDPFAAFPSFAAALSMSGVDSHIAYPPSAIVEE